MNSNHAAKAPKHLQDTYRCVVVKVNNEIKVGPDWRALISWSETSCLLSRRDGRLRDGVKERCLSGKNTVWTPLLN